MIRSQSPRFRVSPPVLVALIVFPLLVALVAGYIEFLVIPQERAIAESTWKGLVRTTAVHWQIALESWLEWLEGEARAIAGQPVLQEALLTRDGGRPEAEKVLEIIREEHRLTSIQLLAADGVPIVSAGGRDVLEDAGLLVRDVLSSGKAARQVSRGPEGGGFVSWWVPLPGGEPGRPGGILVVKADLWQAVLSRLDCAWGTSASIDCAVLFRDQASRLRLERPRGPRAPGPLGAAAGPSLVEASIFDEVPGSSLVGFSPAPGGREMLVAAYRLEDPGFAVAVSVDRQEVWKTSDDRVRNRARASWFVVGCAFLSGLVLLRAQHIRHAAVLAREESRFSAVLSQANDVILFVSLDGRILDANQKAESTYGRTRQELREMTVADLRAPGTAPAAASILQKASLAGSLVWETVHRDRTGRAIPFEVSGKLVRDGDSEFILAILRDISERKKAEEAVQYAQAEVRKLLLAVEQSPVGVMITSRDGAIEYVNRRFCEMTGYTRDETLGKSPRILSSGAQEPRVYRELWETILAGREWRGELLNRKKSGERYWESMLIAPVVENGSLRHFIAVKEDISEKKRSEELLRDSKSQLLHAQKMEAVGRLAGGVAHDFNNLLSVILGYAELAEDSLAEAHPVRRNVQEIRKAGQRAASLTRQLLAFSRKQPQEVRILDLNQTVNETRKMLTRLIGEDIELEVRAEASPATILADPGQLEQVLMNLAVNARDAMPSGGRVAIRTANEEIPEERAAAIGLARAGASVVLTVADTGQGIPEEIQSKVFEPFFTTKETGKGTGLGLSTVYGIVRQSGGGITLESVEGKGTTFRLFFPMVEAAVSSQSALESMAQLPGGNETILLVEDDGALRAMTSELLRSRGYRVIVAADFREAVSQSERHGDGIDLLLTDLVLPGGNGQELAEKLKEARPGQNVLLVSGYSSDAAAVEAALRSGLAFLQKPYSPVALLTKVREILGPVN